MGGRIVFLDSPTMASEDFAFYGHRVPACFVFLGLEPPGRPGRPGLHMPGFDFNDDAIRTGVEIFCRLALC
jgi:metal-dependent amidase/aminoacylase/carboxypeptidase family protein